MQVLKMAARYLVLLALGTAVIVTVHCCPEQCSCSDKHPHILVDCAYKELLLVPVGLPSNVTTLSLSANRIQVLKSKNFVNVPQVTSLWLAHNSIVTIERNTLTPMSQLRNLDLSYNKIIHFPWEDIANLTALQLLKMNNNEMVSLPKDVFTNLKDLRSLRINNNKFTTIVQVVFTTRKKIPSLLIIVVVSVFLLALATVPLLGATCCHLLYKYQGKTYKLIMKAQNPDQMEKHIATDFDPRASFVESEKNFNPSELGEGDGEADGDEGEGEGEEVEGSVVTESIPESQCKTQEEFEVGSEYSDRLPLGAEAVNISEEINGNYKEPR
uniref:Immunoglobulin superfamily containing leucine-rich repeat 2 n=1 Tax=Electrophorus electricus TaxID=8005 RepID=A0AAY5ETB8_ELEEL